MLRWKMMAIEELAPGLEEHKHRGCPEPGLGDRQCDAPEGRPSGGAVHRGSLLDLHRQLVVVVLHRHERQRHGERGVGDDERRRGVDQPGHPEDREERPHHGERRDHAEHQHRPVDEPGAAADVARQSIAGRRPQDEVDRHHRQRDQRAVLQRGEHEAPLRVGTFGAHDAGEVREPRLALANVEARHQRIEQRQENPRQHEQVGQHRARHRHSPDPTAPSHRSAVSAHAVASLPVTLTTKNPMASATTARIMLSAVPVPIWVLL